MTRNPSEVEQAVSRTLRDSLAKLQQTSGELNQAVNDLVSACASARPSNSLPPMLRARSAAASLAASLEVLSKFVMTSLQSVPALLDEELPVPVPRVVAVATPVALVEVAEPAAEPVSEIVAEPVIGAPAAAPVAPIAPVVPAEHIATLQPVERVETIESARPTEPALTEPPPVELPPAKLSLVEVAPPPAELQVPEPPPELAWAQEPEPDDSFVVEEVTPVTLFSTSSSEPPAASYIEELPPEAAGFDISALAPEEQELHRRANRVAKVSMQDVRMLRPGDVALGREHKDLCKRLRDDIEKAHKEYDRRFHAISDHPVDYFYDWMVEILGDGDPQALGEYPYPSPVLRR